MYYHIISRKQFMFLGDDKECFRDDKETQQYLLDNLKPENGDVIIISSSNDPFVAEISVKNSAL